MSACSPKPFGLKPKFSNILSVLIIKFGKDWWAEGSVNIDPAAFHVYNIPILLNCLRFVHAQITLTCYDENINITFTHRGD
jgi:hypothetical protein